ncbi:MAG: carbohydrate ABC transporter permease, partial [Thermoprotei archaeon]
LLSFPPSIIPEKPVMNSYLSVFKDGSPYLITSLGITLINTMITLLLSSMLAYAIAVHKFSGEKLLMYIFYLLATPTLIYIVPLFSVLRILNLINTWWGLILTYPIMTLPISTWIMYNYYSRFPKHVDESAQMDGMNKFKAFVKMALPLSKSGLSVAAVYTFTYSWSALIFPLAFTYTPYDLSNPFSFSGAQTFSIYIGMLMSPVASNYVNVAAAGLISIVPPLILLILARKNLETMWGGK